MDTALQPPQEHLGTEVPETNNEPKLPGGAIITNGVVHVNQLDLSKIHPYDLAYPLCS